MCFSVAVLFGSVAGSLLCQVMYSLLLLPLAVVRPLLHHLLTLLEHLNELNCYLPNTAHLEDMELEGTSEGKDQNQYFLSFSENLPNTLMHCLTFKRFKNN